MFFQIRRMITMPLPVTVQSLLSGRNSTGMKKGRRSNLKQGASGQAKPHAGVGEDLVNENPTEFVCS